MLSTSATLLQRLRDRDNIAWHRLVAMYTPLPGQPGFNPAFLTTYIFVSDGTAQQFLAALHNAVPN